jgi:hypothetical protein
VHRKEARDPRGRWTILEVHGTGRVRATRKESVRPAVHSRPWRHSPSNGVEVHDVHESSQHANWNIRLLGSSPHGHCRRTIADSVTPAGAGVALSRSGSGSPGIRRASRISPRHFLANCLRRDRPTRDSSLCDRAVAAPRTISRLASFALLFRARSLTCTFVGETSSL